MLFSRLYCNGYDLGFHRYRLRWILDFSKHQGTTKLVWINGRFANRGENYSNWLVKRSQDWSELSGISKNRGFEKLGFCCLFVCFKQAQHSPSFLGDSKAREERKGSTRRGERGTCSTIPRENNIEGALVEYCTGSIIGFLFHQTYDVNNKIACLQPVWISKASSLQRRGRAGR